MRGVVQQLAPWYNCHRAMKTKLKHTRQRYEARAKIAKALAHPSRLLMLEALEGRELCVCDLAAVLGMTSSAVSHQLRVLRNLGLVKFRKEGRMAFYFLANNEAISLVSEGLKRLGSGQRL